MYVEEREMQRWRDKTEKKEGQGEDLIMYSLTPTRIRMQVEFD